MLKWDENKIIFICNFIGIITTRRKFLFVRDILWVVLHHVLKFKPLYLISLSTSCDKQKMGGWIRNVDSCYFHIPHTKDNCDWPINKNLYKMFHLCCVHTYFTSHMNLLICRCSFIPPTKCPLLLIQDPPTNEGARNAILPEGI